MILICFDGSPDAAAAIDRAAGLLHGQPATVLTVWEGFVDIMARSGAGAGIGAFSLPMDVEGLDEAAEGSARKRAEEGADAARRSGLDATASIRERTTTIAETILAEADAVNADLVVLGSRGLTSLKSALLGSVSHTLLQHADRSVLVVPSPEVAAERARHRHGLG